MITCENCKHNNPDNAEFCQCGRSLVATVMATPVNMAGAGGTLTGEQAYRLDKVDATRIFCDNDFCLEHGHSSPANASFCGYCEFLLPLPVGATLENGRWQIEKVIDRGGMGRVYLAWDLQSPRREAVALKELLDERGRNQQTKQSFYNHFENEATVLESLKMVRSVPRLISNIKIEGPRHFFVMEYIDGIDLGKLVEQRRGPLEVSRVLAYATSVLEVLEIMHNKRPPIVHRDIKPENLRLRSADGSVALLDFGIARNVREGTHLTKVGSAGYAAPEQMAQRAEPRSDLYSLAATLYFLLSNKVPEEPADKMPGRLRQLNPQVSPDLEEIILANLSDNPNERYNHAGEFLLDLRQGKLTQTIRCNNCGAENNRQLIFCASCATPLSEKTRQCPCCKTFIPFKARFCPNTGKPV